MRTKIALNYLGQLRLYSLVDLIIMLYAGGYRSASMLGPVLIWIGFLSYLESRHRDKGRDIVPLWVAIIFAVISLFLFGWERGLIFAVFSFCYTKKKWGYWGLISPLCRGCQVLPVMGLDTLGCIAACVTALRNAAGDWRDVKKDRAELLKTWPVVLGVKGNWLFLHLLATLATTWLWTLIAKISPWWAIGANLIQVSTYWLTPRTTNLRALAKLRRILRFFR